MNIPVDQVDWRRLAIAMQLDHGHFDFLVSKQAWDRAEDRGCEVHCHANGELAGWINEDFPAVVGTDLGEGM
jgi:hypothetical protein